MDLTAAAFRLVPPRSPARHRVQGEVDHGHAAGRADDAEKAAEAEAVGIRIVPVVKADLEDGRAFVRWLSALVVAREFELERAARQLPAIGGGRAQDV